MTTEEKIQIIEKAKSIEKELKTKRIELNRYWVPNWSDFSELKFCIFVYKNRSFGIEVHTMTNCEPLFGWFRSEALAKQFVGEQKDKLEWYFFEYVSVKDKLDLFLASD